MSTLNLPSTLFAGNRKTPDSLGFFGRKGVDRGTIEYPSGRRAGVKNTCPSAVRRGQVSCFSAKTHKIAHHSIIFCLPISRYTLAILSSSRYLSVRLNGMFGLFSLSPDRETLSEALKMPEEPRACNHAEPCEHVARFEVKRASTAAALRGTRSGKGENEDFYGALPDVRVRMTGVTTRRAESKTECRGRDKPLRLTRRKIRNPHVRAHTRAYTHTRTLRASCARHARIMLACARYAGAGHYLINTTKASEPYLAYILAFLVGVKNLSDFYCFLTVQSGMLNTLLRGTYGSVSPLPLL